MSYETFTSLATAYPGLWDALTESGTKNQGNRSRTLRLYPVRMSVLSDILEFNQWVFDTSTASALVVGLTVPRFPYPSMTGPDPQVLARLSWLTIIWTDVEKKDSDYAEHVSDEGSRWLGKISQGFTEERWTYQPAEVCPKCGKPTIMRYKKEWLCVNTLHRDTDGDWLRWET